MTDTLFPTLLVDDHTAQRGSSPNSEGIFKTTKDSLGIRNAEIDPNNQTSIPIVCKKPANPPTVQPAPRRPRLHSQNSNGTRLPSPPIKTSSSVPSSPGVPSDLESSEKKEIVEEITLFSNTTLAAAVKGTHSSTNSRGSKFGGGPEAGAGPTPPNTKKNTTIRIDTKSELWSEATLAKEETELLKLEEEAERLRRVSEKQKLKGLLKELRKYVGDIRETQLEDSMRTRKIIKKRVEEVEMGLRKEMDGVMMGLGERTREREREVELVESLVRSLEGMVGGDGVELGDIPFAHPILKRQRRCRRLPAYTPDSTDKKLHKISTDKQQNVRFPDPISVVGPPVNTVDGSVNPKNDGAEDGTVGTVDFPAGSAFSIGRTLRSPSRNSNRYQSSPSRRVSSRRRAAAATHYHDIDFKFRDNNRDNDDNCEDDLPHSPSLALSVPTGSPKGVPTSFLDKESLLSVVEDVLSRGLDSFDYENGGVQEAVQGAVHAGGGGHNDGNRGRHSDGSGRDRRCNANYNANNGSRNRTDSPRSSGEVGGGSSNDIVRVLADCSGLFEETPPLRGANTYGGGLMEGDSLPPFSPPLELYTARVHDLEDDF